jgi:hypothetical protein
MDGLDIYIDDYSKPDPLPPGMLERMVQSDMLNLFRKSSEELTEESQQSVNQPPDPQIEDSTLATQQQSDLTSTQPKSRDQLEEVSNKALTESEHKKT